MRVGHCITAFLGQKPLAAAVDPCTCMYTLLTQVASDLQVTVMTSDMRFAGTDADVFIELHGESGGVGKTPLENSANNFERNRKDVFTVRATDIGAVQEVEIWHANNGAGGSDWHLQEVRARVR